MGRVLETSARRHTLSLSSSERARYTLRPVLLRMFAATRASNIELRVSVRAKVTVTK